MTDDRVPFLQACDELIADRQEITDAMPALEALAAPCGGEAVIKALSPLVALYGVQDKAQGEWKAFWGFYIKALADLPLDALRRGIDDYTQAPDSEFFPKPGPLKALCDKRAAPVRIALSRARRVVSPPEISQAERQYRLKHYADTREWRAGWGERPA